MSTQVSGPKEIIVTGMLMPTNNEQPVWLALDTDPGCLFLPLFSDEEKLKSTMKAVGKEYEKVKLVEDGRDFLLSIPLLLGKDKLRIAIDLRQVEGGKWRWTEIQRVL